MVKVVRCKMTLMGAHRQRGNLVNQIAVGVPINKGQLITVSQAIRAVVGMIGINFASLIDDAIVFHFDVGGRLKIGPAILAPLGAVKNFTQYSVKQDSSFRCRHPLS